MHVLVMGAGVVGVSTAYFLLKAGHRVTVLDRQPVAGNETSFANGGQVSVSHTSPWAGPGVPWQLLKWVGRQDAPLLLHPRFDPALFSWGLKFLANCSKTAFERNQRKNLRLAQISRFLLSVIRDETGIQYHQQSGGILQIFRNNDELLAASRASRQIIDLGCEMRTLDVDACLDIEPALEARRDELAGGIFSPGDESGDAHLFCTELADYCAARGADFRYGAEIEQLGVERGQVTGVATNQGFISADAYVLSLAAYGARLVKPFGIKLPIYPTKGYSVTVPTGGHNGAPSVSITDEDNKLVFTRLGERMRVAGTAEFAGFDTSLNERRARSILEKARYQFPSAGNFDEATFWTGLRPMTPDGLPLIGTTALQNLYLNTGHGTLGWTLGAGSGKAIADVISGSPTDLDLQDFSLQRFK